MKRGWLIGLVALLGLIIAAPAMAVDFSTTGYMGIGYRAYQNVGGWDDHVYTNWVQRFELFFHAAASKDLKGVVRFRMDSVPHPWGTAQTGRNALGTWGGEQVTVEVKEAYLDFKIPGIECPTWLRAGVQGFLVRPEVFLAAWGPGVSFRTSMPLADGTFGLSGGWGKIREYDEKVERAVEIMKQKWTVKGENQSANLFFLAGDYKAKAGISGGLYVAWATGNMRADNVTDPIGVTGYNYDAKGNIWWIGLYSDGKVGPFTYNFDLIYNTGREKHKATVYGERESEKQKYNGWLVRGVLTYPYEQFNFGLGGLYVSGVNYKKLAEKGKYTGFVLPFGTETMGPQGDSLIVLSGWGTGPGVVGDIGWASVPWSQARVSGMDLACMGWPGVWGVRLFADYKALNWLTLSGQVAYWGDTVKYGNAFEGPVADKKYDDKDIGLEVNLGAKIDIYKNLAWRLVFGYLFAGDAMDGKTAAGQKERDDPYAFVSTLIYTF